MSTGLTEMFTTEELRALLQEARLAHHSLVTKGGVQEVRVFDRLTRFHPQSAKDLLAWIKELEAALGIPTRAKSRPVYF